MADVREVRDTEPGIRRRQNGDRFTYVGPNGKPVGVTTRERADSLAIPPAWEEVWITRDPRGHIQATGRDQRGRKQYIYHPDYRAEQDAGKFERLIGFGERLPGLRDALRADLATEGLSRDKVVAAVVRVMEHTFTRVGSDRYARENQSYGVSTFRCTHVEDVTGTTVRFRFHGKGDKATEVDLVDPRVAKVVAACQELPGDRLFEYVDEEGEVRPVGSGEINDYLHEMMGADFTSKDFRTWAATTLMAHELHQVEREAERESRELSAGEREAAVRRAVETVADRLENTPAVCRASYIHPAVPAAFLDGSFLSRLGGEDDDGRVKGDLLPEERLTLRLLCSYQPGRDGDES